ncbi:hypothetical protein [Mycobacteroides abscessus]|uniref:hypothetical protein n=1 Tax=Mycobacteroides abscessus TaxID=36809 RepID=UPI0009A8814F|nr:hypothetical protein [Mycobacteroides abscessus]SKO15701.1 Uncharacterised protein [Mycobacteroides abscessus subsp. bolletii]SKX37209.1 Uncharacterised protein [Mycobacteroides abscessus subsp. bolletii]
MIEQVLLVHEAFTSMHAITEPPAAAGDAQIMASGDLIYGIPRFWNDAKGSIGVIALIIGGVGGAVTVWKGFASAMGKVLTGICVFVAILGSVGIGMSIYDTVNNHSGGVLSGNIQIGR